MLIRYEIEDIVVMFCGNDNSVNFRYARPEAETSGERLISFMDVFLAQNAGWALVGNTDAVAVVKDDGATRAEFLKETQNGGVLHASFHAKGASLRAKQLVAQTAESLGFSARFSRRPYGLVDVFRGKQIAAQFTVGGSQSGGHIVAIAENLDDDLIIAIVTAVLERMPLMNAA
jgi:hypothetical protein